MKRRIKNPLSPLQQTRLIKIAVILALSAIAWLLFAPNMGVISLHQENKRLEMLQQQKYKLEQENAALQLEIEKIQNDIEYFEKIAREKHGLLKKNEIIFDFNKEQNKQE